MNNVFIKLKSYFPSATTTEKTIINYILDNSSKVINFNIRTLSKKTFTSPSSIIRLCKNLGYDGYNDLKLSLIYDVAIEDSNQKELSKTISEKTTVSELIDIISNKNQQAIINTAKLNDEQNLIKAVSMIEKASNINLFGMGSSLLVALDMHQKFLRVQKSLSIDQDWHLQLLNAKSSNPTSIAVIFSYSGETYEMIECAKALHANGTPIIAVTGFLNSPVAKKADVILQVAPIESVIRTGALSSRMAQLNIVDLLYSIYIIRNYEISIKNISKNYIEKEVKEDEWIKEKINWNEKPKFYESRWAKFTWNRKAYE